MSKHNKPYHNYNNYSNNTTAKPAEPVVEETVETTPVTEEVEQVEATEIEAEPAVVETVAEEPTPTPAPTIGVVNCKILRMRNKPTTDGDVLYNLPEGTEVQIDEEKSTADFYNVTIPTGAEGFCMKKFITIK